MASTASTVAPTSGATEVEEKGSEAKRKNTSFKITNILPSRPPSHDPEESGDDDPDDSHTEDISEHFEYKQNFVQVRFLESKRSKVKCQKLELAEEFCRSFFGTWILRG